MSIKVVSWTLLAATALATVVLFNYWASFQPLSTLAYCGIALALAGLANLVLPFRFLGVHQRKVGAPILAVGVVLALAALFWPASMVRVAQSTTRLDDVMPEYQFYEKHSARIHARPEQVLQAVRQSTFGDMKSLVALLRIRAAALRLHDTQSLLQDMRVLDAFSKSGYLSDATGHEIVMFGVGNPRHRPQIRTLQEFVDYRESGAVKMAFNLDVRDAGGGWSNLSTETRVVALDATTRRGMGLYWRLIVPGSGLLRRQWLDGIGKRAESASGPQP